MVNGRRLPEQSFPGSLLGTLLKQLGLSREELAERMNLSLDTVNNWCSQRSRIKLQHLSRLVKLLRDLGASCEPLEGFLRAQLLKDGLDEDTLAFLADTSKREENQPVYVLGSHLYSGSYESIILGVHDAMQAKGKGNVIYLDICGRQDVLDFYLDDVLSDGTRGIIFVGIRLQEYQVQKLLKLAAQLASQGIPSVFVPDGLTGPVPGTAIIKVDVYQAAAQATKLLWDQGHRNIVALAMAHWLGQRARVQGYQDTMERLGGTPNVIWALSADSGPRPGAVADRPYLHEASDMISEDREVTAILALSASAVKEVMRALHQRNRLPGRDIAVLALGCWDWMHNVAHPPITHVALPYYEAGLQAAHVLIEMAKGGHHQAQRVQTIPLPSRAFHLGERGTMVSLAWDPAG